MESSKLYRVEPKDFERLEELLTACFLEDPLYCSLIPDENARKHLLPKLFDCDLHEFFESCEIYADSKELNSLLVVSDESEPYNVFHFYMTGWKALLKTDEYLIQEDHSLKLFWNFFLGRDYLNENWTDQLHQENRLHIIYLAVHPSHQHHGIANLLIGEVINYAIRHRLMVSLETHNEKNVDFYRQFGFKVYGTVEKKHFNLKQYCMIREVQ